MPPFGRGILILLLGGVSVFFKYIYRWKCPVNMFIAVSTKFIVPNGSRLDDWNVVNSSVE